MIAHFILHGLDRRENVLTVSCSNISNTSAIKAVTICATSVKSALSTMISCGQHNCSMPITAVNRACTIQLTVVNSALTILIITCINDPNMEHGPSVRLVCSVFIRILTRPATIRRIVVMQLDEHSRLTAAVSAFNEVNDAGDRPAGIPSPIAKSVGPWNWTEFE